MSSIIKNSTYEYDAKVFEEQAPLLKPRDTVIKRGMIDYSVPEKVRLGMLPPDALYYYEMMKQQEEEKEKATKSEEGDANKEGSTFWANDTGERVQISQEEYDKFLEENTIGITSQQDRINGMF